MALQVRIAQNLRKRAMADEPWAKDISQRVIGNGVPMAPQSQVDQAPMELRRQIVSAVTFLW